MNAAVLRDERGEFGRKVQVKDVTDEIVRVTDQALDAIFPRRRSQKREAVAVGRRGHRALSRYRPLRSLQRKQGSDMSCARRPYPTCVAFSE